MGLRLSIWGKPKLLLLSRLTSPLPAFAAGCEMFSPSHTPWLYPDVLP